ncbi:hypothetical protein F5050DRAFT_1802822 [Lentinula boryana]|uniref:Uncharacterized protein n=1 Tax=Lentinula boryana TaxID=40481 RepID=A0ABQ8QTZ0_9AGAR|nr:hypothetical protein F5050DRAFT_1802822 [Lentinula boryana]
MAARRPLLNMLRRKPLAGISSRYHAFSAYVGDVQPFALPHIEDIFDAPVRLPDRTGGRRYLSERGSSAHLASTTITAFSSPAVTPTSLPAPLLFEGPAHPRSSFLSLLTKPPRQMMRPFSSTSSRKRSNKSPGIYRSSTSTPTSISNASMHTYDGPSNITRYRYSGQKKKNDDGRKPLIALVSLATLAAGATVCLDL